MTMGMPNVSAASSRLSSTNPEDACLAAHALEHARQGRTDAAHNALSSIRSAFLALRVAREVRQLAKAHRVAQTERFDAACADFVKRCPSADCEAAFGGGK